MTNTAAERATQTKAGLRWGRMLIGAVLLEGTLLVAAVPLLGYVANPFAPGGQGSGDFTIFFVAVAVACFVAGSLWGWWVARPLSSQFVPHGALTGIIATAIYLGICSIPPTTIAAVVAGYGPFWFFLANGLRIVGASFGAAYRAREGLFG